MNEVAPIRCDAADDRGIIVGCRTPPTYECRCRRCSSEKPEDRFHACQQHVENVRGKHIRIYDKEPVWFGATLAPAPSSETSAREGNSKSSLTVSVKTASLVRQVALAEGRGKRINELVHDMARAYIRHRHADWGGAKQW